MQHKLFVLWGSAGHAKVLADVIDRIGGRVAALFDNNPLAASCLPGVPLYYGEVGFAQWVTEASDLGVIGAAMAIGGARGEDRLTLAARFQAAGLSLPALIHPDASVSPTARIGDGTQVLAGSVVAADAELGRACIVNNSASVDHETKLGNGVHVAPGAVLCGCVSVEDNAFVGARSVVLPRIRIGRSAIIGAGAVVTKDVPEGAVVVGNPARTVKGRE